MAMDRIRRLTGLDFFRSVRSRLLVLFLLIALIPPVVVGFLNIVQAQNALRNDAIEKLVAVRNLKARQVELYSHQVKQDILPLSEFEAVADAATNLGGIVELQGASSIRSGFLGRPDLAFTNQPYGRLHYLYHPTLAEVRRVKGYDDILIISPAGDVVYTVAKRDDFGTDLVRGPYQHTNLALLFRNMSVNPEADRVRMTDYAPYPPAADVPISFVGTPIMADVGTAAGITEERDEEEVIGFLVYALTLDQLDVMMQDYTGLGDSGETYLVGADRTIRSGLRLDERSALLEQTVDTLPAQMGLAGESGVEFTQNYRGVSVLSAYQPVEVGELKWVLLAEVSTAEAFAAADRLGNLAFGAIVAATAAVIGIGTLITRSIANPIISLSRMAATIVNGDDAKVASSNARDEIGALADAFHTIQQKRELAEEANQLKSDFLSTVSHELRTPLSLLVGLSEMLLRDQSGDKPPLPKPYRQDLARIHVSAQQLDGLVRDVLDLASSQVGQLRLLKKPVSLGDVLGAVSLVGEQMAKEKGLEWQADIPEELPWVWGDRTRLQQVVLNLISNAVKFTSQGEVRLQVKVAEECVTVAVSDTGLGIPVAEQEVIFDEFRQSERTTVRGYGGLGIGLALCRQLVELHGGEISVESSGEDGGGSTFRFTLPTMQAGPAPEASPEIRNHTVLLLSKLACNGTGVLQHLTQEGFEVETLAIDETPDWLSQVLASPPGAVVLDFEPAARQGWELIEMLKRNPVTENIPVLFYSLLQGKNSGSMLALDYLTKPLDTAALMRALKRQGMIDGLEAGRKTILVVDDEPGVLNLHARIVQAQLPDCLLLKATNGREALAKMQQAQPDLVLLDLMMPELDGFGVLEAMQESDLLRAIPVIVLTAQAMTEQDMARLNQGVATVLQKGVFSAEETLTHIEDVLSRSKNLRSDAQQIVRRAMAYIHEHYAEPISREDMAAYVGVGERHLDRCFCDEAGITPTTYLSRYRIKQAKLLLESASTSITEVAMSVGFSSSSYFTRVFQSQVGLSPSAYRQGKRPAH